jgi:arylsulfatase A-like enzyme
MDHDKLTRRELLKVAASVGALSILPDAFALADDQPKRPNILLLFPDEHRPDWMQFNAKLPIRTPNLVALGSRGVRFNWAFTPSPLCAPARACLAAGKEYDRCGVANNRVNYPVAQTTFYKLLRDSGYHVMGCGKFDLHKASSDWGLDGKHLLKEWGFSDGIDNAGKLDAIRSGRDEPKDPYMAYLEKKGLRKTHIEDIQKRNRVGVSNAFPTPLPDDAYCDNWVGQNGIDLIRGVPDGKPWFLQVNFTGPHPPWDVTESMYKMYQGVDFPQPNGGKGLTPEQFVAVRRNYAAMVTNIDRWVGVYIDELKKRGELENTLIVYSSDHGEMLGDHGLWGKSVPYQPSVGVPLVIAGPGPSIRSATQGGRVSDALVSTVDLAGTFLDYAGVARPSEMDSLPLRDVLEGKKQSHRDCVLSGLEPWRIVFDGRYKLVRGFPITGDPALFDLKEDLLENKNIAAEHKDTVERLSRLIRSH